MFFNKKYSFFELFAKHHLAVIFGIALFAIGGAICGTWATACVLMSPLLFGIAFALAVFTIARSPPRILVNKFMISLGRISYGVYIFHFFMLDLIRATYKILPVSSGGGLSLIAIFVAALGLSAIIALAAKITIEEHGIVLGRRIGNRVAQLGIRQSIGSQSAA